jgi:hypothetical protein
VTQDFGRRLNGRQWVRTDRIPNSLDGLGYIATLFVVWQVIDFVAFRAFPGGPSGWAARS